MTFSFNIVKQPLCRPVTGSQGSGGRSSQISRQSAHEVVKFVNPRYRPPLSHRKNSYTYTCICYRLSRHQDHGVTARIMSMTKSRDKIRNRTCNLPACSTVPQPNASPRDPQSVKKNSRQNQLSKTSPTNAFKEGLKV